MNSCVTLRAVRGELAYPVRSPHRDPRSSKRRILTGKLSLTTRPPLMTPRGSRRGVSMNAVRARARRTDVCNPPSSVFKNEHPYLGRLSDSGFPASDESSAGTRYHPLRRVVRDDGSVYSTDPVSDDRTSGTSSPPTARAFRKARLSFGVEIERPTPSRAGLENLSIRSTFHRREPLSRPFRCSGMP